MPRRFVRFVVLFLMFLPNTFVARYLYYSVVAQLVDQAALSSRSGTAASPPASPARKAFRREEKEKDKGGGVMEVAVASGEA